MQEMPCVLSFALDNAGNSIAARIAIMATTTSSSIRVNPRVRTFDCTWDGLALILDLPLGYRKLPAGQTVPRSGWTSHSRLLAAGALKLAKERARRLPARPQ